MTPDRVSNERLAELIGLPDGQIPSREARDALRELQHLRSPVTVSDEMVERYARSHYDQRMGRAGAFDDAPPGTKATERNYASSAITAALVPAEQEGEVIAWGGDNADDLRLRSNPKPIAPTHPGGDSRVVAWRHCDHDINGDAWPWCYTTMRPEREHSEVEALVPLSSLEAVEREMVRLLDVIERMQGSSSRMAEAFGKLTTRAETAEASLAATRSKGAMHVTQLSALLKLIKDEWIEYDHVFSISVHDADQWVAALAGSNGE